ncbi:hypothetical protein CGRA01v4_03490 [Colletotrichum graminicola]|nr:hypothetical protein CGRA01v4_03490 [Colletotrichum graminicola]
MGARLLAKPTPSCPALPYVCTYLALHDKASPCDGPFRPLYFIL